MSVVCQINCVGGITYGPRACSKSFFGGSISGRKFYWERGSYLGHFFIKYYSTYVLESSTILTFAMLGTAGIISDVIIAWVDPGGICGSVNIMCWTY